MDVVLARTFLEIVGAGSFIAAAERLHVTQTAVSARVRALEDLLQRRLFVRNRGGARLTPAGERFVAHASALVQVWERARQQVALPAGSVDLVSIGAEVSLWNPLLADLLIWLRRNDAELALRAEVDIASSLLDRIQDGSLDLAVLYRPEPRPDLVIELLAEEKLVMVTTAESGQIDPDDYVYVDWGRAYAATHDAASRTSRTRTSRSRLARSRWTTCLRSAAAVISGSAWCATCWRPADCAGRPTRRSSRTPSMPPIRPEARARRSSASAPGCEPASSPAKGQRARPCGRFGEG